MAKDPTATGEKKTRAKRTAKAKRVYLMFEGEIPQNVLDSMSFARNGDDALDTQADAKKAGRVLSFTRVTLPAPAKKVVAE